MPIHDHPMADNPTNNYMIQAVGTKNHNQIHPRMVATTGSLSRKKHVRRTTVSLLPRDHGDSTAFLSVPTRRSSENMERTTRRHSKTRYPPQHRHLLTQPPSIRFVPRTPKYCPIRDRSKCKVLPTNLPRTNAIGMAATILRPILDPMECQLFEYPPQHQQHTLLCKMPHSYVASSSRHLEHPQQTPSPNRSHPSRQDSTTCNRPTNLLRRPTRPNPTGPPYIHNSRIHYG